MTRVWLKAYGVSNHYLKLQCKKFNSTRDISNCPTQGWVGTAFCTRKRSETYLNSCLFSRIPLKVFHPGVLPSGSLPGTLQNYNSSWSGKPQQLQTKSNYFIQSRTDDSDNLIFSVRFLTFQLFSGHFGNRVFHICRVFLWTQMTSFFSMLSGFLRSYNAALWVQISESNLQTYC